MRLATSVLIFNLFCVVSAAVYNVTVGNGGQLAYDPSFLTGVNTGDVINFQFTSKVPHSVTESTFEQPCAPKSQGRDSGILTNGSATAEYSLPVNDVTSPLWFHCMVSNHCSSAGMVFAVNPTTDQSFNAFKAKATGTTVTSTTPATKPTSSAEEKGPIQKMAAALAGAVFLIGLGLW